jgi:hypothetical protein
MRFFLQAQRGARILIAKAREYVQGLQFKVVSSETRLVSFEAAFQRLALCPLRAQRLLKIAVSAPTLNEAFPLMRGHPGNTINPEEIYFGEGSFANRS